MIGRIRRLVAGSTGRARNWDAEWQLEPEADAVSGFPVEDMVMLPPKSNDAGYTSEYVNSGKDHYADFVRDSIAQEGRSLKYEISVWWLRLVLDGLEGRDTVAEEIWGEDSWDAPAPRYGSGLAE